MTPKFRIIAGPNGSGKSTLTRFLSTVEGMIVLDPDAVAKELHPEKPEAVALQAGRVVLQKIKQYFAEGQNFSIETTLSSASNVEWMRLAKQHGFWVELFYVALEKPEYHITRVHDRVIKGGHHVPTQDIVRRYERSLKNLPIALAIADSATVYGNAREMQKILEYASGQLIWQDSRIPNWVTRALNLPLE
jgi:predicted ABC-type ATPase